MDIYSDPEAFSEEWEEMQEVLQFAQEEVYPSFRAIYGRAPIEYVDFDPLSPMCQDDYEFYTGTGRYSDNVRPVRDALDFVREAEENDVPMDGDEGSALASAGWGMDEDY